jgi:hypothetical protein
MHAGLFGESGGHLVPGGARLRGVHGVQWPAPAPRSWSTGGEHNGAGGRVLLDPCDVLGAGDEDDAIAFGE